MEARRRWRAGWHDLPADRLPQEHLRRPGLGVHFVRLWPWAHAKSVTPDFWVPGTPT